MTNIEKAQKLEAYRLFEGQDNGCRYLEDKIVKTRKEHCCNECNEKMKVGEYAKFIKLIEDAPETYYYHIDCASKIYDEFYEE